MESTDPREALFAIMEELYNADNDIDEERVGSALYYLCDHFGMDTSQLGYGMNVVHKKTDSSSDITPWFQDLSMEYARNAV